MPLHTDISTASSHNDTQAQSEIDDVQLKTTAKQASFRKKKLMPLHTDPICFQMTTDLPCVYLPESTQEVSTAGEDAQTQAIASAKQASLRKLRLTTLDTHSIEINADPVDKTGPLDSIVKEENQSTEPMLKTAQLDISSDFQHEKKRVSWLHANRYLFHNMLLLCTNVLAGIFAYLLHPFLGHVLGIQQYGQVAALIALTVVLTTPTQIISTVAAKYASSLSASGDHAQLNDFIRRLTVIFLVVGVVMTVVFLAGSGYVASFLNLNSPQGVIILGFIFIIEFVTPLNLGTIQGLESFGWFSTMTFLSAFLRLTFSIGFVLLGMGVNGVILGIVVSAVLAYLISFLPLVKVIRGPRAATGSLRGLWSYSALALIAAGGIVALSTIDTVLARHFLNAHDAGLYAALATIGKIVLFVTSSVSTVMFPKVVALHKNGRPHTREALQAILTVLLLSVVAEIPFVLAPGLITRLMFGPAFAAFAVELAPYGLAMLLLAIGQVLMTYFLACGNRSFVIMILSACILQTGLIFWHHADIAQLVSAVITTNAALVFALLSIFGLRIYVGRTHLAA